MAHKFGVAALNKDPTAYADTKFITVPTVDAPRAPTTLDVNYPIQTIWRERDPNDPTFFCEWILIGFDANGAQWRLLVCSTGPSTMLSIETDDGAPNVIPDAMGEIQIFGGAGIDVTGQGPGKTVTVSLAGGSVAVDSFDVDFATVPGVDPVLPDAAGLVAIFGNTVTNATNANSPVATHTRALNQFHIDVQLSAAVAASPGDPFDAGLCSFDDSQFTVDGNGFVQLAGGGLAIDQINVDANTAPGTDPVLPDGSGEITVSGAAVAAHSIPVETHSRAANAYNIEVQVTSAVAASPGDTDDAGLASFDTAHFDVDSDGFVQLKNPTGEAIGIANLGFTLDSGTFSVTAADGSALSATNPGYVTIWSREATNPGTMITIPITANQSFDDASAGGGSEITGNLFGTTTGVAWNSNMPFGVKAVLNDNEDTIQFMLSRNIWGMTTPGSTDIGAPDDAVADKQNDYWSFDNIDETLFDGNPSMLIGVIYMQKDASDDWTVQGLFASGSGSNYPRTPCVESLSNNFSSVAAHFGAATGTFMIANGGTAPTFTTQYMRYQYAGPQTMRISFQFNGNTATDGAGAVNAQIAIPYTVKTNTVGITTIVGSGEVVSPGYTGIVVFRATADTQILELVDINGTNITNANFSDGDRLISGTVLYRTGDNP